MGIQKIFMMDVYTGILGTEHIFIFLGLQVKTPGLSFYIFVKFSANSN